VYFSNFERILIQNDQVGVKIISKFAETIFGIVCVGGAKGLSR
jgi:hypothetical protein